MKILVAAITFGITIGGLFLFENYKTAPKKENYAQIIRSLTNQNQSEDSEPRPTGKFNKTAIRTPAPSATPSFTAVPTVSLQSSSPTPLIPPAHSTNSPQITPAPTVTPASEPTPTATPTPTPQPTQQSNQIMVISLTSPVQQNSTAQLDIKTSSETQCSIKVILPSGSQSSAKGLEDKTADNSGTVTWSWKINWNTTPGTANIDLACSKDEQSFSKFLQMIIIER